MVFYHSRKPTPYVCMQKLLWQYKANTVDEPKQYPEDEEEEDLIQQQKIKKKSGAKQSDKVETNLVLCSWRQRLIWLKMTQVSMKYSDEAVLKVHNLI